MNPLALRAAVTSRDPVSDTEFDLVANQARELTKLSSDQRLQIYGLFKQAKEGDNKMPKPSLWDATARAKWSAWSSYNGWSQEEARIAYVYIITTFLRRQSRSEILSVVQSSAAQPVNTNTPRKESTKMENRTPVVTEIRNALLESTPKVSKKNVKTDKSPETAKKHLSVVVQGTIGLTHELVGGTNDNDLVGAEEEKSSYTGQKYLLRPGVFTYPGLVDTSPPNCTTGFEEEPPFDVGTHLKCPPPTEALHRHMVAELRHLAQQGGGKGLPVPPELSKVCSFDNTLTH